MYTAGSTDFPQGMDPVAVIQSFDAAWNAHDAERVLKFFTDDAVVRFMYPPPFQEPDTYTGKDEIRQLLAGLLSSDFRMQSYDHRISLNQMTWQYQARSARFRRLGAEVAEGSAGAAFEGGKIKNFTLSFSPETTAILEAGLQEAGMGGPISEGVAGMSTAPETPDAQDADGSAGPRPNRGPTWEPVGSEDHQPPVE